MSFARNFALGAQAAGDILDTFYDARRRRDLGRIADAKPEETSGFSEGDADQMHAMSKVINPETGQPYYSFEDNGQGGLQVRNNFSYAGADGQTVAPGSTLGLQTRQVTDFLGRRHEGRLNADQQDALRYRAMADVVGRSDPAAGIRMRRELKNDDRAEEEFGWRREDRGVQAERNARETWRFGREVGAADREDADRAVTETVRTGMAEFMNARLTQPDGTRRAPTPEDGVAALQHQASLLAQSGRPELAGAAMRDYVQVASAQIQLQTAERTQAFGAAAAAAQTGDLGPMVDAFNRYVPDGTRVLSYVKNKDGSLTVKRETLDGQKLPDAKLSGVEDLLVALQSFRDPGAMLDWSQQQFKNNLEARRVAVQEGQLGLARQGARQNRELKPETVAALNDLRDKINQEPDPAKRRQLENDWNRMYSMASTELGRVVMPRSQAEVGPLDKERLGAYFKALAELGPNTPQGQVDALAARFGVTHLIKDDAGGGGGGLPGWGDAPPARPTAPSAEPPVPGTPGQSQRGVFTDSQGRTQLLEPFSRFNDWRRRMVEEANERERALGTGLSLPNY